MEHMKVVKEEIVNNAEVVEEKVAKAHEEAKQQA